MRVANIENGGVAHIWEVPALDCYGDTYQLVEAPEWVQIGATWDGSTFTNPVNPNVKVDAWSGIKAERDRRKAGGVKVGAKWFHSDDGSRIQANLQWKTMDGSFIAMTQTLASQVFQAVAASDQAIFTVAEQHKAAMEASADPASYDYSGGWPKIYGE